mgnify:CR=1 FL=1
MNTHTFKIEGMCCSHCDTKIIRAISNVGGVQNIDINMDNCMANIQGEFDVFQVEQAVTNLGYQVVR